MNKVSDITFSTLQAVCRFTGDEWVDRNNCNHYDFSYEGELEGYGEDAGYLIRSDQPCCQTVCPFLNLEDNQK